MDKGKSAMPLLAIVAIVAVVAVVMVVLQGRTPSSEEAVAGEATGPAVPGIPSNQKCLWKTPERYPARGNDVCLGRVNDPQRQFVACEFTLQPRFATFYDSADGTCSGKVQLLLGDELANYHPIACNIPVDKGRVYECSTSDQAEPFGGDYEEGTGEPLVLCCKK